MPTLRPPLSVVQRAPPLRGAPSPPRPAPPPRLPRRLAGAARAAPPHGLAAAAAGSPENCRA